MEIRILLLPIRAFCSFTNSYSIASNLHNLVVFKFILYYFPNAYCVPSKMLILLPKCIFCYFLNVYFVVSQIHKCVFCYFPDA